MAAADAGGVALHVAQEGAARVGQLAVALEHDAPLQEVGARVNQHAFRLEPVAAGASRFLLVVLERLRRARVHDEAHVGAIDPHPERHRRDDDVGVLVDEGVLVGVAILVGEAGVIRHGAHARGRQPLGERVNLAARRAIDDAGVAALAGEHVLQLLLEPGPRHDAVEQVRPVERPDQLERSLEVQLRRDVAPDACGCRGGEGVKADAREPLAHRADLAVLRAEVVAPLTDAVRFVDRDVGDTAEPLDETVAPLSRQTLRRYVEQRVAPLADARRHGCLVVGAERAVVAGRVDAVLDERVDLVLHQRDEGRDDEREAAPAATLDERRRLEAERLAAAGWQDDDRVAAGEDRVHRLALQRPERGVAPVGRENGLQIGEWRVAIDGLRIVGFGLH